ncbi:MAG: YggS family pyridoxal phosphate-dependent enzyme [Marinicellaceae bacterium]
MSLINRYLAVKQRIDDCKCKYNLERNIDLLAVSKKHSIDKIRQLFDLGQKSFGESYVDEALKKIESLSDLEIEWHFIGPLQSNKSKYIAQHFAWVHSIDSLKLLRRLNAQRQTIDNNLNVLLQLKVGDELTKRGLSAEALIDLASESQQFLNLTIRGLMCIPAPSDDIKVQKLQFDECYAVYQEMQKIIPVDTLSMGMSADLESAIISGTTMVRIGTDIFGSRTG